MPRRARPLRPLSLPHHPSVPVGQAAALDATLDQTLVRTLGALPLLLPLCDQLGLRAVVNRRCYPDGGAPEDIDLGRVVLVLVLNRLLAPQPLVHVERWLAGTMLPELLGLTAAQCNDDRLARALDALLPHLDALWQDLIVAALTRFDLDLRALCYDLTSLSFCGAYDEADLIRYGYSRDHRPDQKQVELATTVTAAGGVPLDYRVLAGNVADRTTPVENLRRLRGLLAQLPPRDPTQPAPVVVSDRAMLTVEALAAYAEADLHPLGPLDPSLGGGAVRDLLATVPAAELAAAPLAYRPRRAVDDAAWEDYHGVERPLALPHPDPSQPSLDLRALVVWSPGKARLDAQLRATHLTRLEGALADLAGKVGRRPYTTTNAVQKRVRTLLAHHPGRRFVTVAVVGGTEDAAPLHLTWVRQEEALAAAATLDGRYVLGTTAPEPDAAEILRLAKQRDVPEKRFALVKGPLAVRPLFVHKEGRVLGVVWATMVALLLFALLELQVRQAGLSVSGQTVLAWAAPLAVVLLLLPDGSTLRRLANLAPPLADLLQRLDWPPADCYC
ncbi:MAG: IS1634 family transposase [Chloroflexota bacterium]|nr:IS1634 family transposase [Chloroflexota bacterium]